MGAGGSGMGQVNGGFRSATPNSRYAELVRRGWYWGWASDRWGNEGSMREARALEVDCEWSKGLMNRVSIQGSVQRRSALGARKPKRSASRGH